MRRMCAAVVKSFLRTAASIRSLTSSLIVDLAAVTDLAAATEAARHAAPAAAEPAAGAAPPTAGAGAITRSKSAIASQPNMAAGAGAAGPAKGPLACKTLRRRDGLPDSDPAAFAATPFSATHSGQTAAPRRD